MVDLWPKVNIVISFGLPYGSLWLQIINYYCVFAGYIYFFFGSNWLRASQSWALPPIFFPFFLGLTGQRDKWDNYLRSRMVSALLSFMWRWSFCPWLTTLSARGIWNTAQWCRASTFGSFLNPHLMMLDWKWEMRHSLLFHWCPIFCWKTVWSTVVIRQRHMSLASSDVHRISKDKGQKGQRGSSTYG